MLRRPAIDRKVGFEDGFRWRGTDPNRFEGFSDAVFGFAITLLVVSLEVPRTFDELLESMRGFFGFAICFAVLVLVWYQQYLFFRRYGLEDRFTIALNSVLLFVVLFYVYPLKFVFTFLIDIFSGRENMTVTRNGTVEPILEWSDSGQLMLIYSIGFIAVYAIFALLFRHAYRLRDGLELNEVEIHDTVTSLQHALISVAIGLLSVAIALFAGSRMVALSGWIYFLLGPALGFHGAWRGKRRKSLQLEPAPAAA